jgi:uncharacterized protein (TIGR02594 family)
MFRSIFTDVPSNELDQLKNSIVNFDGGTIVSANAEPNGSFTVVADFPGDPPPDLPVENDNFPWMAIAEGEIGVKEGNNPRITEYFTTTSLGPQPDSVPWCSAFVNFCVTQSDNRGTNSAAARSWLHWGTEAEDFVPGCIVVIARGNPGQGHVGFFVNRDANGSIRLLGGNQSNAVNVTSFPNAQVLGKRVLLAANNAVSSGGPGASAAAPTGPVRNTVIGNAIPVEGRALLDTIAEKESSGRYNVIFGGQTFSDFSKHPNIAVPIPSRPGLRSTAAGRYQFVIATWRTLQAELSLPNFGPASQDLAAWHLAKTEYHRKTIRDLESDLRNGQLNMVGPALHDQWTSLPGGMERGVNASQFVQHYSANLDRQRQMSGS